MVRTGHGSCFPVGSGVMNKRGKENNKNGKENDKNDEKNDEE